MMWLFDSSYADEGKWNDDICTRPNQVCACDVGITPPPTLSPTDTPTETPTTATPTATTTEMDFAAAPRADVYALSKEEAATSTAPAPASRKLLFAAANYGSEVLQVLQDIWHR